MGSPPKNTNTQPKTENKIETAIVKPEVKKVEKEIKIEIPEKMIVKFSKLACCPEGTFNRGEIREVSGEIGTIFINEGIAEKVE